jgi:Ca-activated chloride channel family protein
MILRNSPHKGNANYATILEVAQESKGGDESGYRSEFITLVKKAQSLPNYRYQ